MRMYFQRAQRHQKLTVSLIPNRRACRKSSSFKATLIPMSSTHTASGISEPSEVNDVDSDIAENTVYATDDEAVLETQKRSPTVIQTSPVPLQVTLSQRKRTTTHFPRPSFAIRRARVVLPAHGGPSRRIPRTFT
jgi:hypothetical protein